MRNIVIIIALALIVAAPVYSADYLRIGVDSLIAGNTNQLIPLYVERTCPDPSGILGHSNQFVIRSHGDVTWMLVDQSWSSASMGWFNLGGGLFSALDLDGISPDAFLIGGAAMSPGGMPIVQDTLFWSFWFDIGIGEGEMCIDSSTSWSFQGLTCGIVPGYPNRPSFVDKYGNDYDPETDGICITVWDASCVAPTILNTPPGDFFEFGYWMIDTTWQFEADPGEFQEAPSSIEMWTVTDGPGEIDSTGLYSANLAWPIGDYNITIEAHNECTFSSYSFTLSSTGNECGNTNGAEIVDVDDIVTMLAYIFMGGQSIPTPVGDVDCSGAIDIDDAVYLLYYIFVGSAPPCDPDDDGIKDCY